MGYAVVRGSHAQLWRHKPFLSLFPMAWKHFWVPRWLTPRSFMGLRQIIAKRSFVRRCYRWAERWGRFSMENDASKKTVGSRWEHIFFFRRILCPLFHQESALHAESNWNIYYSIFNYNLLLIWLPLHIYQLSQIMINPVKNTIIIWSHIQFC